MSSRQAKGALAPRGCDKQPINHVQWIDPGKLRANSYNPNQVFKPEMNLLKLSLLEDGWTQPVVVDQTTLEIIDGYHRWTLCCTDKDVAALTDGLLPVVYQRATSNEHRRMSTIRHNRARGQHHVVKMAEIVGDLLEGGLSQEEIMRRLQMEFDEVDRLSDASGMPKRGGTDKFNKGWKPGR